MVQEVDELNGAVDAYERLQKYYKAEGKIDPDIFAKLRDEMEKFEGSEAEIDLMESAVEQFQVNKNDAESSASARGQLFQVVTNAFKTFVQKPNVRLVARRAVEEIYSKAGEHLIEQEKQSHLLEQPRQSREHAEQGSNGTKFI